MAERILVAIDGGVVNEQVIRWVVTRARSRAAEIELVTVEELGWVPPGGADVEYRTPYEQSLVTAADLIRRTLPGHKVTTTMLPGLPAQQVIGESKRADLLVMGSDKPGALKGMISGTLPLRVAAHSACPVVVVPTGWAAKEGSIVVGVSVDASDEGALEFAAREAEREKKALIALHAVALPKALTLGDLISAPTYDALFEQRARGLASTVALLESKHGGLVIDNLLVPGVPAQVLVKQARNAKLLVVGTHRRGAIGGLILGSVTHDVLLNLPCPVVVVPPDWQFGSQR